MKLKQVVFCLALIIIAGAAFSAAEQPRYLEITFLSTNDLHGKLWPFDVGADPANRIEATKNVGGAARRAAIIRRIRSEMRTPVVLVDCGDIMGWTHLANAFHGEADIAVMNAIGYEAMAAGNHEFEWHAADMIRNRRDSNFPWLCANLVDAKTGELFLDSYIIREVDGVRIAFFGLMNDLVNKQPDYYKGGKELGLKVLPEIEVAAKLVPELRKQADIVVLLSHLGYREDVKLAQDVPGIDIILGAHSHSTILTPTMVEVGERTAFSLGRVPVVQAGYHGIYIGKTRTIFRRDPASGRYTLMSCKGELVKIDSSIPDDPEILGIIQDFQNRIPPTAPAK